VLFILGNVGLAIAGACNGRSETRAAYSVRWIEGNARAAEMTEELIGSRYAYVSDWELDICDLVCVPGGWLPRGIRRAHLSGLAPGQRLGIGPQQRRPLAPLCIRPDVRPETRDSGFNIGAEGCRVDALARVWHLSGLLGQEDMQVGGRLALRVRQQARFVRVPVGSASERQ